MVSHTNPRRPDKKHPGTIQDTDNHNHDANKIDLRNEIQQAYRSHPLAWPVWVFNRLELSQTSRVLELGSGTGTFWQENADSIPGGWKIHVSDCSFSMVQKARSNMPSNHCAADFINLDGQALPYPSESFDAVLAVGVLDLVPDLNQALSEAWRVLRPFGQLIASAGGKGHLQELEDLLQPFLPPGMAETLGGNETHFGLENGKALLERYFEEVVRHEYHDQLVFRELNPILDYVLSEQEIAWSIPLSKLGEFVKHIKRGLQDRGKIGVTVRKGVFVARKKVT